MLILSISGCEKTKRVRLVVAKGSYERVDVKYEGRVRKRHHAIRHGGIVAISIVDEHQKPAWRRRAKSLCGF